MEFLNWKNILLEWVNGLNFLRQPYYNLTQTDIEVFFDAFKKKITSVDVSKFHLGSFLKDHYPTFNPIYNENKNLCHEDYIFVYSLLLHFSCVKYQESNFQNLCKDFQTDTQLIIATFLKNLIEWKSFTRETLESVILSSVPAKISDYIFIFSPTKSTNEICPPTPRTKMLNTWNCENKQLKALLETERFEKGFLEIQQRKLEEKLSVLSEERRQFIAEIQQLRSQISVNNSENIAPNGNIDTEVLKRRLRKEISERGDTISKLQQQIDDLTDNNRHLTEKVAYVQSEYNKSIESANDLSETLALFRADFEKSQQHVKGLELTIKEYQNYFNELSNSSNKVNSSDVSVNLDDSYAQAMATLSSMSTSSPENLGQVVDLQLRDQVRVNDELLVRCNQLQDENSKLSEKMDELNKEHSRKTSVLEMKCTEIQDENTRNIEKFEEKLREIANLSKEFERNVSESQLLKNEFNLLIVKANESQRQIDTLTLEKDVLENRLAKFSDDHDALNRNYENILVENTANLLKISVLESKLNDLQLELDNSVAVVKYRNSSIAELKQQIEEFVVKQSKSQDELDQLAKELENCQSQIQNFVQDKHKISKEHADSITERDLALQELEKEKIEFFAKIEELEESNAHVTARLRQAETLIVEAEALRLGQSTKNKELLLEKNSVLESMQKENDEFNAEVSRLNTSLVKVKVDLQAAGELNSALSAQNDDFILQKDQSDKEKDGLKAEVSLLTNCLADMKAKLIAAEEQHSNFTSQTEELQLEKHQLENEKDDLLLKISVMESKLNDLQLELDNFVGVVECRNFSIAELKQQIDESVVKQSKSQDELDQLAKELENCQSQIQSFVQDKHKMSKEHADSISERDLALQELEKEKIEFIAKIEELEESNTHVTARLNQAETLIVEAEALRLNQSAKNKELLLEKNSVLESMQKENEEFNAEVTRLNTSLVKVKVDLQAAGELNSVLSAQNDDFILQKDQSDKEKNELKAEVSLLTNCLADMKVKLIAAEEQHSNFTSQTDELQVEKQQLEKEKNDLSAEISRLNICLVNTEANLIAAKKLQSKFSSRGEELLSEKKQMEKEKNDLDAEISCLSTSLTKIRADLTTSEELQFNLSTRNEELLAQIVDQENQIQSLTADLDENKGEQGKLNGTIIDLTKQLQSYENENQKISSSIADLTNANQSTQLECQSLREQLQSMECIRQDFETQLIQSEDEKEKLFLNLQEKMDEAEATELNLNELSSKLKSIEATNRELLSEKNDLTNEISGLKSNCSDQLIKINDLQKETAEFASLKEQLLRTSDKLRLTIAENDKTLVELRSELELIHNNAEQDVLEMQQLTKANELLRTDSSKMKEELNVCRTKLIDAAAEVDIKTKEIKELRGERIGNEQKFNDLEIQRDELKKNIENLEIERYELSVRLQNADEVQKSKNDEFMILIAQNRELATRSEALLIQESKLGDGINKTRELVEELTKELNENKIHLSEKEKLIISSNNQMIELSNELKELGLKLTNAELSKENLNMKCTSLIDNLKEAEQKRVVDLQLQSDNFTEQIAELAEATNQKHQQLADLTLKLISSEEQITSASMEIQSLKTQLAETTHLKDEIEKMAMENESLVDTKKELTTEIVQFKVSAESYQKTIQLLSDENNKLKQTSEDVLGFKSQLEMLTKQKEELEKQVQVLTINIEHMSVDLGKAKSDNQLLGDQNIDLATEIEKVRSEFSVDHLSKATEISVLQAELQKMTAAKTESDNRVIELEEIVAGMSKNSTKSEEYSKLEADLQVALTDLQSKIAESNQSKEKEIELRKDLDIFSAKLIKNREELTRKETEWTKERTSLLELADTKIKENRLELEGKLDKMKEKMKHLYTEETTKARDKQLRTENELSKLKTENQQLVEKNDRYETHVRQISKQLYQLNERQLELQKENGIVKNQLRILENNPHGQRMHPATSLASIIKMEDEEGQVFNNTYLTDLKSGGRISPTGRESVRLSELQIRNSKAAPHLRSTYAAQYGDQNLKEEDISMGLFNDSMMSNQSDIRRGTLYQRPGPPTPSKNGGRLSFGGNVTASDLFPKDILREQNNNAKTKTTPGKLMSMFSSSKPKVENPTPKKRLSIFKKKTNV